MKGFAMNKRNVILRSVAFFMVILLCITGVLYLKPQGVFEKAFCFSVSNVMNGVNLFALSNGNKQPTYTDVIPTITVADGSAVELSSHKRVTESITQNVFGNIIQKTVSAYNAKQNFGKIYMNNKSGATVDIESELYSKLGFKVQKGSEPQILIYHTHTTESYLLEDKSAYTEEDNTRTTDNTKNVVAVGEKIAEQLRNAGYTVLHDETLHDYPGYSGSYNRSLDTVKKILKDNPSIKITIDVHRDAILSGDDKIAPTVKVNGKEAAQVMLVMGSETGSIKGHPDWRQNLKLALKLQYVFESTYPGLARALSLKTAKYNQHLTTGSMLIEMGSDANTLEQALYSGELVGKSLVTLLNSQ